MAIVRAPFHSIEASGTCGPLTAVRGRRGTNLRGWGNQCDPRTLLQTVNRRRAFAQASERWGYAVVSDGDKWIEFARGQNGNGSGRGGVDLSPRNWFMRFNIRRLRYGMGIRMYPPLTGEASYSPAVAVTWGAPGATLTWSPAIPAGGRLVVRQARNEARGRLRPVSGSISHILDSTDTSPLNITGPVGGPAVPAGWPPVAGWTTQHIHVFALDDWARSTPVLYWRLFIP